MVEARRPKLGQCARRSLKSRLGLRRLDDATSNGCDRKKGFVNVDSLKYRTLETTATNHEDSWRDVKPPRKCRNDINDRRLNQTANFAPANPLPRTLSRSGGKPSARGSEKRDGKQVGSLLKQDMQQSITALQWLENLFERESLT